VIFLAAAFELVPLLVVIVVATLVALPSALGLGVSGWALKSPALAAMALLAGIVVAAAGCEWFVRRKQARRETGWLVTLDELGPIESPRLAEVGGKAILLARLHALGVPVPSAIVLTTTLVDRFIAGAAAGQRVDRVFPALPAEARRLLEDFLAQAKGKIVARASFTDSKPGHSYAGVFPSARDLDPRDREHLVLAILGVVQSSEDQVGREYRKRRHAASSAARAVLLQRQIDAEVSGTVASRGPHGRADCVTIDFSRRRSPSRSFRYDLIDGTVVPLAGEDLSETPAWMHRLAAFAVFIEREFGGPVHVEFAIENGAPYLLDVRVVTAPERKTWVHAEPLDVSGSRLPTFAQELRGGLPLVRDVLTGLLARAGAKGVVEDREVRYADGLVYFDAEVLRRVIARLARDVLLRGGLRSTLRSIAPVRKRPLPAVPQVHEVTADAWHALRSWHGKHLLGAAQVRLELVAREWLIRALLRLIDGTGSSPEDRRGHPALRYLLARRVREASAEAERQRTVLEKAEAELSSAVARVLARGAEGWNAMFKGDRHLHAALTEIDAWHQDVAGRDALENEWRTRREAFDARKGEATMLRVHRPEPPAEPPRQRLESVSLASGRGPLRSLPPEMRGLGVVAGKAQGPLVLVQGAARGASAGAIIALTDGRSEYCAHLFDARGVVLLSGGIASPVALLAAELSVPTILCTAARSLAMADVAIDGTSGMIQVRR
jgi:phosphohistidine swiveling domain-containing protein